MDGTGDTALPVPEFFVDDHEGCQNRQTDAAAAKRRLEVFHVINILPEARLDQRTARRKYRSSGNTFSPNHLKIPVQLAFYACQVSFFFLKAFSRTYSHRGVLPC
jgi:hypothetical protein